MARPRHERIPELLSTKKSVSDLTGAQPANEGFSCSHGPQSLNRQNAAGHGCQLQAVLASRPGETMRPLVSQIPPHSNLPCATHCIACSRQYEVAGFHDTKANGSIEPLAISISSCPQLNYLQPRIGSMCQQSMAELSTDALSTIFS